MLRKARPISCNPRAPINVKGRLPNIADVEHVLLRYRSRPEGSVRKSLIGVHDHMLTKKEQATHTVQRQALEHKQTTGRISNANALLPTIPDKLTLAPFTQIRDTRAPSANTTTIIRKGY